MEHESLQDLDVDYSTATKLYCDNQSAIQISHNDVFHERNKHIEIDCHFILHHLLQSTLILQSVSSRDQLANIFTKPLSPRTFRVLTSKNGFFLMGLEKWAHHPTRQAQRNGIPNAIPRPLGTSPKRRPGPLGPKDDLG